jgi:SAM-dependent methyltransferase
MDSSEASAFDGKAQDYDAEFTSSALGQELRARVWQRLAVVFLGHQRILELGCGTGEDAVRLARAGHRVVAIDASAEMIRVARQKAVDAGCAEHIEFHCLPMESLDELPYEGRMDGVFSNFGAINCVADMAGLSRTIARRVQAGAPLLFVAMGRYVPWEWAWYLARGDTRRAFRRFAKKGTAWRGLTIHYPTPGALARSLAPLFEERRRAALGFALPPSYAAGWLDSSPRALSLLSALERATSRFTAPLGDHYILEAVRQ